jgi:hypothetical protein
VTLGVIAAGVALGLLARAELLQQGRDMRSSSTSAAGGLEIRRLTRAAETGRRSGTILTRRVAGRTWHIAYSSSDRRICWVLVMPGGHPDGTCGTRSRIRESAFIAYAGQLGRNARLETVPPSSGVGFGRRSMQCACCCLIAHRCASTCPRGRSFGAFCRQRSFDRTFTLHRWRDFSPTVDMRGGSLTGRAPLNVAPANEKTDDDSDASLRARGRNPPSPRACSRPAADDGSRNRQRSVWFIVRHPVPEAG